MQENTPQDARLEGPARTGSAALIWAVAAGAWILGAFCLVSLTWDGSYYLFGTLQDGFPMMPHRRWFNWILLTPVLWAQAVISTPAGLAVVHGLMCAVLPLSSLAACLRLLRGAWARMRFWAVLGILLLPLPGQLPLVGEVTVTLQCSWVLFAFAWRGCPPRWAAVALFFMAAMATLHPVAAPLFFLAAVAAALSGRTGDPRERRRMLVWTGIFAAASAAKFAEVMLLANAYEHANLHGAVWKEEFWLALRYTPLAALIPVLADVALGVWSFFWRKASVRPAWLPRTSRGLWAAAFALGLYYSLDSGGWCSAINYRKFGIVVTAPVALLAAMDAARLRRSAGKTTEPLAVPPISPVVPALLFAAIFSGMALSWQSLWSSLQARMEASPGQVVTKEALTRRESDSALNHWSTTSLSLILQGWEPRKVFLWEPGLQLAEKRFRVCPGDAFQCRDKSFKIGWLRQAAAEE